MPKMKNRQNELVTRAYTAEFRASEDENERGVIDGNVWQPGEYGWKEI